MTQTIQSLHPTDAAKRDGKPIPKRPRPMCLSSPVSGRTLNGRRRKARGLGREYQESFAKMKSADVAVSGPVELARTVSIGGRMRKRQDELCYDLLHWILRVWQAELLAK